MEMYPVSTFNQAGEDHSLEKRDPETNMADEAFRFDRQADRSRKRILVEQLLRNMAFPFRENWRAGFAGEGVFQFCSVRQAGVMACDQVRHECAELTCGRIFLPCALGACRGVPDFS